MKVSASEYGGDSGEVRIATGDIDGDRRDEVVLGFGPTRGNRSGGWFRILDNDLSHLAWGRVGWKEYNATNGETHPAIGDLNGDGLAEIVLGLGSGGQGLFEVFSYGNSLLTSLGTGVIDWPEYQNANGETRPAVHRAADDRPGQILIGLRTGGEGRGEVFEGRFGQWENTDGFEIWQGDYRSAVGATWPAVKRETP